MADKKTRATLEDLFSAGKIPSQVNFSELIASGINQMDDGIQKAGDTALKIQAPTTRVAAGKAKDYVLLYEDFKQENPNWSVRLRAGGFELSRATEPDVVIDKDGKVGIGTAKPLGPLAVGDSSVDGSDGHLVIGKKQGASTRHVRMGYDETWSFVIGDYGSNNVVGRWTPQFAIHWQAPAKSFWIDAAGKTGLGTDKPPQQLSITGGIGFANQNAADKKLYSPADGTLEWMTHDAAGQHGFAVSHQGTQRVFLNTQGNSYLNGGSVGIGTNDPKAKLHVVAAGGFGGDNADGTSSGGNVPIVAQSNSTAIGIINGSGRQAFALNIDGDGGNSTARGVPVFYDKYNGIWNASLCLKNGSVGIGTGDPKQKLHLNEGYVLTTRTANNDYSKSFLSDASIPNHSVLMASVWAGTLYFYYKSEGRIFRLELRGIEY